MTYHTSYFLYCRLSEMSLDSAQHKLPRNGVRSDSDRFMVQADEAREARRPALSIEFGYRVSALQYTLCATERRSQHPTHNKLRVPLLYPPFSLFPLPPPPNRRVRVGDRHAQQAGCGRRAAAIDSASVTQDACASRIVGSLLPGGGCSLAKSTRQSAR